MFFVKDKEADYKILFRGIYQNTIELSKSKLGDLKLAKVKLYINKNSGFKHLTLYFYNYLLDDNTTEDIAFIESSVVAGAPPIRFSFEDFKKECIYFDASKSHLVYYLNFLRSLTKFSREEIEIIKLNKLKSSKSFYKKFIEDKELIEWKTLKFKTKKEAMKYLNIN